MSVNLEYFRTFYYVATYKSMGKAAAAMNLTPPTVTKTIQALEDQLECQLFVRTPKGVHLTAAGETLFSRVKPGINLLEAGEHEISLLNSLEGGTVRIGMSEAAAHYFTMPAVFGTFCRKYPNIKLYISHLPVSSAKEALLNGDIDFAILGIDPQSDDFSDFNVHDIYISENVAVVGKKYKDLAKGVLDLTKLSEYPLIFTHSGFKIREYYERAYRENGVEFSPNIETPTLDIQIKAVKLGLGYSFVPYPHIKADLENGDLYKLMLKDIGSYYRTVCLISSKVVPQSKAAKALMDVILDATDQYLQGK